MCQQTEVEKLAEVSHEIWAHWMTNGFFYVDTINLRTNLQHFGKVFNKLHRSIEEGDTYELGPGECYALLAAYEELAGIIAYQARTME